MTPATGTPAISSGRSPFPEETNPSFSLLIAKTDLTIIQQKQLADLRSQIEALNAQIIEKTIKYISDVPTLVDVESDASSLPAVVSPATQAKSNKRKQDTSSALQQNLPKRTSARTHKRTKNDSLMPQQDLS